MPRITAAGAALAVLLLTHPAPAQPKPAEPLRPVLDGLRARCIGPANMGGRIVDLAVVESKPETFYVAAGGGGVWKTTDAGVTLNPVFDDQPTLSIGSVAICQAKPDVVYVGSGEGNPRNSVSWGSGVYKSADGGKSWAHCGLAATHHIGRVVVHPENPDIAYVAAMGHFWGPNAERGMYKTADGGKTWALVKFIDEDTGFIDVQMDPSDLDTLYAAAWQTRRDGFSGGNPITGTGPNGGLFKTTDAGKTWTKLTDGLPDRPIGRCGIGIYRKDPNIVYAVIQTDKTALTTTGQAPKPGDDTAIGGVFRSDDKGKTWKKLNDLVPRPFYYGQVRVDPTDDQRLYVLGVSYYTSNDGGITFAPQGRTGVHPDHHALWINPGNPDHLILGNDGGLYVSKDRGKTYDAIRTLVISQFYGVAVDSRTPYRVYGGLQDNGSWGGPVATRFTDGVTIDDWRRVGGGDGFQCAVDPTDSDTVYAESQYGALNRVSLGGAKTSTKSIRPPAPKGSPNRFNWNSPLLISPHDPATLYYGGQFLFRTTNRGDAWEKVSADLTRGPKEGPVTNSGHTLSTIAESPVTAGVLWVGTDDGKLWLSKDGGKAWIDLSETVPDVPNNRTISRIECSNTDAGTAYLAIDRHRNDDFKPYLYRTTDYGQTWKPLTRGLPDGAVVGVVRESSKNKNLLFAGTELGLYASLDAGKMWHHLNKTNLPGRVRVDDVVIHPRERELVIGTHGRGIWVMDIAMLEQLTDKALAAEGHLFDLKPVTIFKEQKREKEPAKGFAARNPPRAIFVHYLLGPKGGAPEFKLLDPEGRLVLSGSGPVAGKPTPGLRRLEVEVKEPGEYTITLRVGDYTETKKVLVKME